MNNIEFVLNNVQHITAIHTSRGEASAEAPLGHNYITTLLGDISEAEYSRAVERIKPRRDQLQRELAIEQLVIPREYQAHSIHLVDSETKTEPNERLWPQLVADAMWTTTRRIGLAVSVADCAGILVADTTQELVAAIHSGHAQTMRALPWRTIRQLPTDPTNLQVYVSAMAGAESYEVQPDFKTNFVQYFDRHFAELGLNPHDYFAEQQLTIWRSRHDLNPLHKKGISFDNRRFVYDQLIAAGVPEGNVTLDQRNTMDPNTQLHSARLDGYKRNDAGEIISSKPSGAQLAVITLK